MRERKEIVFRPTSGQRVVTSPEQLADSGIFVHPLFIEQTWGENAIERYNQAMHARRQPGNKPGV